MNDYDVIKYNREPIKPILHNKHSIILVSMQFYLKIKKK